jgi:hypothetical protein
MEHDRASDSVQIPLYFRDNYKYLTGKVYAMQKEGPASSTTLKKQACFSFYSFFE